MGKRGPRKGFKNLENIKKEKINTVARLPEFKRLMREADDASASYWKLEASSREQGYEEWMKKVKKISHFIDVFKC